MENCFDAQGRVTDGYFVSSILFTGFLTFKLETYRNDPKFSDRQVWANSADPDQTAEQSDQGLHCLLFRLRLSDTFLNCKATSFEF